MFSRREPYTCCFYGLKKEEFLHFIRHALFMQNWRCNFAVLSFNKRHAWHWEIFYSAKNCQRASSFEWNIFLCPLIDWHRILLHIDILCRFETCALYRILPLTITWFKIHANCKIAEAIRFLWLLLNYQCSFNSVSWVTCSTKSCSIQSP